MLFTVQYEVEYLDDRLSHNGIYDVDASNEDEAMKTFNRDHVKGLMSLFLEPMSITANAAWPRESVNINNNGRNGNE